MSLVYAVASAEGIAGETVTELAGLIQLIIGRIPLWIGGFIVIVLSVFVAKIARRMMENKLAEKGIEEEHKELQILGGRITYITILLLGVTVGLKIAGIDLTTILAAVAFGIGFALKDLIMNFLAGIMILVGRHFSIGDFIKIGGTIGRVIEIQSRVTVLQAIDGTKVIVPNGELFKKQVISFTSNPFRRVEVLVGIDYRSNLENALKICMKVFKTTKGVLSEPKSSVLVSNLGDSAIELKLKFWVDSKGGWVKIKSNVIFNIKKEFDKYGVRIPWPIRTISYDKDEIISEKMMEAEKPEAKETPAEDATAQTTPITTAEVQVATVPVVVTEESGEEDQPLRPLGERR